MKLSELIRVALRDLSVCESDPRYKIDMRYWHVGIDGEHPCLVCLAGAFLAGRLNFNSPNKDIWPSDYPDVEPQMRALNCVREGCIHEALDYLNDFQHMAMFEDCKVIEYFENPDLFKKQLTEIADLLEEGGA